MIGFGHDLPSPAARARIGARRPTDRRSCRGSRGATGWADRAAPDRAAPCIAARRASARARGACCSSTPADGLARSAWTGSAARRTAASRVSRPFVPRASSDWPTGCSASPSATARRTTGTAGVTGSLAFLGDGSTSRGRATMVASETEPPVPPAAMAPFPAAPGLPAAVMPADETVTGSLATGATSVVPGVT
jgi:hypothetical protein